MKPRKKEIEIDLGFPSQGKAIRKCMIATHNNCGATFRLLALKLETAARSLRTLAETIDAHGRDDDLTITVDHPLLLLSGPPEVIDTLLSLHLVHPCKEVPPNELDLLMERLGLDENGDEKGDQP